MVTLENVHLLNCRSEYRSLFRIPISWNYLIIVGIPGAQGVHTRAMYIPFFQDALNPAPVYPTEQLVLVIPALLLLVVVEIFKYARQSGPPSRDGGLSPSTEQYAVTAHRPFIVNYPQLKSGA
ncbi:MAG: cation transporting ATPase C-terminal domain-containing protein [Methanomicrobiaceae archaeon]|nr:cation transporting ATPase C-terminal domain-containing protein [Methanomicrobiaceae archaeon]MDD5420035.1 cation-translocating P-type ATPase C-terminal domain-containing protein [Methanomicrobiaceae archaeon]